MHVPANSRFEIWKLAKQESRIMQFSLLSLFCNFKRKIIHNLKYLCNKALIYEACNYGDNYNVYWKK